MNNLYHPELIKITKIDLIKFQLKWILDADYSLNNTELSVLAYVSLYGREAITKMVTDGKLTARKTVENYISNFRKDNLIVGKGNDTRLNPGIKVESTDMSYTFKFKVLQDE